MNTQTQIQTHIHQCGTITEPHGVDYNRLVTLQGYGCGHIWEHSEVEYASPREKARAHMCSQCGRGPWYSQIPASRAQQVIKGRDWKIVAAVSLAAFALSGCAVVERFNSLPAERKIAIGASVLITGYIAAHELSKPNGGAGGVLHTEKTIGPGTPDCSTGGCR